MISATIRAALQAQLSAAGTGMTARIAALAASYGVDPYAIDFSDASVNFLFGQVTPDDIERSSLFTYPFATIYTPATQDLGIIFSSTFSGRIPGVIEVHHSWPDEAVLADFCSLVDMTEEALIACVKDPSQQGWSTFGNLMLAKDGVSSVRSSVAWGGQNWRQSLKVTCMFELTV